MCVVSSSTHYVSKFLLLQVDPVVQHPAPRLDIREVLLSDTWIKPLIVLCLLLVLSVLIIVSILSLILWVLVVHIEGFVVWVKSLNGLPILHIFKLRLRLLGFIRLVVEIQLCLLRWINKVARLGFSPLFLLSQEVSLLDLFLELVCEVSLLGFLVLLISVVCI